MRHFEVRQGHLLADLFVAVSLKLAAMPGIATEQSKQR